MPRNRERQEREAPGLTNPVPFNSESQVNAFGSTGSVSVCDDSTVYVECLSVERLAVNVTWKTRLENIPAASLPDLHDIGELVFLL